MEIIFCQVKDNIFHETKSHEIFYIETFKSDVKYIEECWWELEHLELS